MIRLRDHIRSYCAYRDMTIPDAVSCMQRIMDCIFLIAVTRSFPRPAICIFLTNDRSSIGRIISAASLFALHFISRGNLAQHQPDDQQQRQEHEAAAYTHAGADRALVSPGHL